MEPDLTLAQMLENGGTAGKEGRPMWKDMLAKFLTEGMMTLGPGRSVMPAQFQPGITGARAIAARRNQEQSASGWPADNVVVPSRPSSYTMGDGGSWRIPYDSNATSAQMSAFQRMSVPDDRMVLGSRRFFDTGRELPQSRAQQPSLADVLLNMSKPDKLH